jgi:hypothetical protein
MSLLRRKYTAEAVSPAIWEIASLTCRSGQAPHKQRLAMTQKLGFLIFTTELLQSLLRV